jgi:CubicO group peptidase (beta-lactamase class C family)
MEIRKILRKIIPGALFLSCLLPGSMLKGQDNQDNRAILEDVEQYINKVRKEWKIPGMAVSVMKDGELIYAKGFGVKELVSVIHTGSGNKRFAEGVEPLSEKNEYLKIAPENRVDQNTLFQIGSISKSFTALVMAQLVDEKLLGWDDTVKNILPDFRMYDKWVQENMQVKDIMVHSTGLKGQAGTYIPNLGYGRDDIYRMLPLIKPAYSFRGKYEYNNITFIIALKIIEKLTGKSWEENVKERIFLPLGMTSSSMNEEGFKTSSNRAVPHEFNYVKASVQNDSTWRDSVAVIPLYGEEQALHWLTVIGPAGSISSSVADMARYAQFHLDNGNVGGKQLVSKEAMNFLHKGLTITSQDSARTTLYAHCWFVEQNSRYRLYFHTGTTWGFTALCAFVPEQNLAMAILVDSEAPSGPRYAIMRRIIDLYKGFPERDYSKEYYSEYLKTNRESRLKSDRKDSKEVKKEAPDYNLLTGVYDKGELFGKATVTLEEGDLYITVGPQGWKHSLIHSNGDSFSFRSDGHAFPLTFKFDKKRKKVTALEIDFGYEENFGDWIKKK